MGNSAPVPLFYQFDSNLSTTAATTAYDVNVDFTYSLADQVKTQSRSNTAYNYNPPLGASAASYNGLNQVSTFNTSTTFSYDNRGNLTSDGSASYSYNANNLLTSVNASGQITTLSYDAENRLARIVKTGGAATTFLYDGTDLIAEYDDAGSMTARYIHGAGVDEPVVAFAGSGTAETDRRYLVSDALGSIVAVTNSTGDIGAAGTGTNAYDEYGLPRAGNIGRFQYTGQVWLPEIGMYYYKARIYAPTLGRFLQPDPIGYGDGMNMYAYVHGDPVNATDPTGLCSAPGADCGVVDMPGEIVIRGRRGGKEDWEASNTAFANMYHPGRPSDDFYRQRDEFAAFRLYTDDTITRPGLVMYLEAITAPSDVIGAKAAVKVGLKFLAKRFSAKQAARRGATTCPACFVAGTQVATPTGLVAIEKIEVGDLVLAYDARTSQVLEKPVRALIRPEPKATYALILKSALGEIETFRATDDHPWFTAAHMWVETKSLKIGDMIETATGKDFTLVSIVLSGKTEQTYNLSVADVHTFMVGENHLVVHNDGHHCIPRQILKQLSSDLRRAVQGKRGDRNIVDIGRQRHIDIHRGGYNNRWTQELTKHGGPRNITEQQLRQIDAVIRSEFKLPPRGG